MLEAGHSRRSIGRQLNMTHRTVKSLADAARPEDLFRSQWQHNRTSILDEYKPYLDERWDEGCTNAWKLWEEIVPLGYRGSYGRVSAYLREKRTSPRPVTAQPPAPRVVTRWILSRPETLTEIEQLRLKTILAIDHEQATGWLAVVTQALRNGEGPGPVPVWAFNTFATLQSLHLHLVRGISEESVPPHAEAVAARVAGLLRPYCHWLA